MNTQRQRSQRAVRGCHALRRCLRFCVLSLAATAGLALVTETASAEEALSPAQHVARANAALADGDFEQAMEGYRQADVLLPDLPELAYNRAIVHYRRRDFAKAREMFTTALTTRDLELETKAKFNLGNCQYAEALETMSNLQEAIDKLRTAIEHYRDTLELAPDDTDARANIETAQLLIEDLLDKLKKQQEQRQQDPTSQPSDCQQQEQQDQPQEGDQQEEQEQQQQNEGEEQQQDEQDGEQQTQEQAQPQGAEEEQRSMTEAEARRLLQAIRDKEQQRRDRQAKLRQLGRAKVTKDW